MRAVMNRSCEASPLQRRIQKLSVTRADGRRCRFAIWAWTDVDTGSTTRIFSGGMVNAADFGCAAAAAATAQPDPPEQAMGRRWLAVAATALAAVAYAVQVV